MTGVRIARAGRLLCIAGAGLGVVCLLLSLVGETRVTAVASGWPPTMPNAAVALALLGAAGALRFRERASSAARASSVLAAGTVLVGATATLAEYAFDVELGIDSLLPGGAGPHPGRPSPLTAIALALLAAAVVTYGVRATSRARPSEWLILGGWLAGFTGLLGLLFGVGASYRFAGEPVIGVALPTALSLLLTGSGLLLERPDAGLMRVATSRGPGGILLRRLVPAAIVVPVLIGLVVDWVVGALGVQDLSLVVASLAAIMTVVSFLLLTVTAGPLDRAHEALEGARARTDALVEQASDGIFVADLDGRYVDVNDAGCRMLGYTRAELVGTTIADLIPPEDVGRLARSRERQLAGGVEVGEWRLRRKDGAYLPVEVSAKILPDGRWQGAVRDIRERIRVEAVRRQAQERLELALRGADLAAWDWNVETGEVIFNPRWAEMRGLRLEDVRPNVESWKSGIHPDDWSRVEQTLQEHFQGRLPEYESQFRVRHASGAWIWILDRGKVFERDERGRPKRMVGTELDVTERKRLEEELHRSEAQAARILSISADAIVSIDEAQRITMFNEGAERIFGHARTEVIGAPLDVLIPERLRAAHRRHVERFAAGSATAARMDARGAATVGRRKNGEEFPADATISKLDVGGTRILTVAVRDVTEQKRVESDQRLLAEAGAVLASTLDYEHTLRNIAGLAVRNFADYCLVDVVDEDDVVRRLEVAARDPSKADVCAALKSAPIDRHRPHLARPVPSSQHPVLLPQMSPETVAALAQSDEALAVLRAVDPTALIAVPLVAHGKLLGGIAFVSSGPSRQYDAGDVALARELAARAALSIENARLYRLAQRAIRLRDEVLGVVAHDLRNPLSSVVMHARLLTRSGDPDGRARKSGDAIHRAAFRMNRLIQDLLDVTRIEAGRLPMACDRVSVTDVVAEVANAQSELASSASLELRVDVAPGDVEVWANRDRLHQVFENLVGNALKFTAPGGRVTVGAAPGHGEVLFRIADTGAGIAADQLPHLFDRFWQAPGTTRHGAGLGLAVVKGIVEAHGGRIWVESAPGQGSTFFFTIPTAPTLGTARSHAT